ncbi:MAG: hypothetical protein FH753_07375 [Firmicutes bacterium]|nr:hypothetical protein [Bacillota bacterium]MTI69569.1 hypothetical protein [Bacillota bacterium]
MVKIKEIINPFIEEASDILLRLGNIKIDLKGRKNIKTITIEDGIMLQVGLTGTYEGQFILEMSKDLALKIASNNKGYPIVTVDKSTEEILVEIVNLIVANAVAKLINQGISLKVIFTNILIGKDIKYISEKEILSIPIKDKKDLVINLTLDKF